MKNTDNPQRYSPFDGPSLPRPDQLVGLVDVRCMCASCERVFNPALRGKPVGAVAKWSWRCPVADREGGPPP